MHLYRVTAGGRLRAAGPGRGGWSVCVLRAAEVPRCAALSGRRALAASVASIRFCRAASRPGLVRGTVRLPGHTDGSDALAFAFVLCGRGLFVALPPNARDLPLHALPAAVPATPAGVLLALLEQRTAADARVLQTLERRLDRLEQALDAGQVAGFSRAAMDVRRRLAALRRAYAQLATLAEERLADPVMPPTGGERGAWQRCAARAARLRDEAETLREYILQLWQVYQSRIELQQNRVVTLLTVVTTLFVPLSLVTGWYGMNFEGMLAPSVPWGYPAVAGACLLLAVGGLLFFKWKGML